MRTASLASLALPSLIVLALAGPARAQAPEEPTGPVEQPPTPLRQPAPPRAAEPARPREIGLGLANVNGGGARILSLDPGSPSATLLEPNDVVVTVDTRPIRDAAELREYIAGLPAGAPVLFEVRRDGETRYVGVQMTAAPPPACPAPQPSQPPPSPPVSSEAPAAPRGATVIQILPGGPPR
jgi:S1-C subfamily serine protease